MSKAKPLAVILSLLMTAGCSNQQPQVAILTSTDVAGSSIYEADLALTSAGQPQVAYVGGEAAHPIIYVAPNVRPVTIGLAGNELQSEINLSLALAPDGTAGVAYVDDRGGDLIYAHSVGANWETETVEAAGQVGYFPSLVYNQASQPRLSYFDESQNDIKFAALTPTGWVIETVDATGSLGFHIPAGFTQLALGCLDIDCASERVHLVYLSYRFKPYDGELRYATREPDGTWQIQTIDAARGAGAFPSLRLAPTGDIWLSYYRSSTWDYDRGELRVAHFDGQAWDVTVVDDEGNAGRSNSLSLTPDGRPVIAYYESDEGDLRLAWWQAGWQKQTLLTEGDVGYHVQLAIDQLGLATLLYVDARAGVTRLSTFTVP